MDATGRFFRRWETADLALRTFVLVAGPPAAVLLVSDGMDEGRGGGKRDLEISQRGTIERTPQRKESQEYRLFHFSRESGWDHKVWLTKTMPGEHTLPVIRPEEHGVRGRY